MILIYGNYNLAFTISSAPNNDAAFLTDSANMNDGRSGTVCSIRFDRGTAATTQYTEVTAAITSDLDATAAIGGVGVVNVQGLPLGTKVIVGGITQRLAPGPRGEPCAWFLPQTTGNTLNVQIFNDVNGSHTIAPGTIFGIGEIIIGRVTTVPTLAGQAYGSGKPVDATAWQETDSVASHALLRKAQRQRTTPLGYKSTKDVSGGSLSSIPSGGDPSGFIDLYTLQEYLSTSLLAAICDAPSSGGAALSGGLRYDQSYMQRNWMMARLTDVGIIQMDQAPLWSWSPTWQEAT